MDPGEFSKAAKRFAEITGSRGMRLHDLRHSFATALLAAGVHPKIVSEALGHSSISITLDTYSHVLPTMQDASVKAIEAALGSAITAGFE